MAAKSSAELIIHHVVGKHRVRMGRCSAILAALRFACEPFETSARDVMPVIQLLFQIIVVIACCQLAGMLARVCGQPKVVGEMAAGLLLGPSVFGALAPDLSALVFPPQGLTAPGWISQAAIAVFMLTLGLEQDTQILRQRKWTVIAVSAGGILLPFVLGAALAFVLYPHYVAGKVPQLSFVLFIGTALSMTALPVLARILREQKLLATPIGSLAMAAAVLSDVCTWILLAVVLIICKPGASSLGAMILGLGWVLFMLLAVRPLLARLLQLRPSLMVYCLLALLTLLVSSWIADHLGLHLLLGAFLAGVILPRHEQLGARLQALLAKPMVWALPLFFAYTGLRTHLNFSGSADFWLIASVTIVACLGKAGGAFCGARLTGVDMHNACMIAVLMNARGLMELVIVNIGMDLGLLTAPVFAALVLMAFLTTLMTGPLVNLLRAISQRKRQDCPQY